MLHRAISRLVSAVARFSQPCSHSYEAPSSEPGSSSETKEAFATEGEGISRTSVPFYSPLPQRQTVPPMSLNFCVTDGRHIVCSRYRNHARQDPPSLFLLAGAGVACDKDGSCLRLCGTGVKFICINQREESLQVARKVCGGRHKRIYMFPRLENSTVPAVASSAVLVTVPISPRPNAPRPPIFPAQFSQNLSPA